MDEQLHEPGIAKPRKHWMAIFSLWCGIIGVCLLPGLYIHHSFWNPLLASYLLLIIPFVSTLGIIAGVIGLVIAYRPATPYKGARQAWIGFLCCAIAFGITGLSWASALNYSDCAFEQRSILDGLGMYVKDNGKGLLPFSLTELFVYYNYPQEQHYYNKHYFYWLYTKRPYIMNGYLAGKKIADFPYSKRTLLIAVGKNSQTKYFFKRSDIDLSDNMAVTLYDLDDCDIERIEPGSLAKHFPVDGKVTVDSWLIKPLSRRDIRK